MSYKQIDEARYTCLKCKREYTLSANECMFGLWRGGEIMRCGKCFELLKHMFWLKLMEQET